MPHEKDEFSIQCVKYPYKNETKLVFIITITIIFKNTHYFYAKQRLYVCSILNSSYYPYKKPIFKSDQANLYLAQHNPSIPALAPANPKCECHYNKLRTVKQRHNCFFHQYVEDTQLYISLNSTLMIIHNIITFFKRPFLPL